MCVYIDGIAHCIKGCMRCSEFDKIAQKYIVRNNRPYEEIKCAVTAK